MNGWQNLKLSGDEVVTWIVEKDVFSEKCFDEMVAHLQKTATPYHVVRVIPFIHEIDGKVPKVEGPCVVYGSIGVQKLAEKHGWTPGIWPMGDELLLQLGPLHRYLLNWPASFMKLSAVQEWIDNPFSSYDRRLDKFFIKPNADTKQFAGTVLNKADFAAWLANMNSIGYLEDNDFQVMVSAVKADMGCEWRTVIVNGKISSCSLYRQYQSVMPERHILPEVEELILKAHADSLDYLPAVYAVDVCQVGDDFKIVEYNTFNSAGLYECNVAKIIDDINSFVGVGEQ